MLTATWGGEALVWSLPEESGATPTWLADLAEAVGGRALNEADVLESVSQDKFFSLRARVSKVTASDGFHEFAHWFFASRATRSIAPGSDVSVPEYVARRIKEGTEASLESASRADPGNKEVWKMLRALKEGSP